MVNYPWSVKKNKSNHCAPAGFAAPLDFAVLLIKYFVNKNKLVSPCFGFVCYLCSGYEYCDNGGRTSYGLFSPAFMSCELLALSFFMSKNKMHSITS